MKLLKVLFGFLSFILLGILALYIYPRYIEPSLLTVTKFEQKSVSVSEPIKVVFFGDTHFGELYSVDNINKIVRKINKEKPDIVIFTGDLIGGSGSFEDDPAVISEGLDKIEAKFGKFAVYGNHEYAVEAKYGVDYLKVMEEAGFEVLVNDWIDIPDVNVRLMGLDDFIKSFPDKELSAMAKPGAYNILMTHEPDIVDEMDLEKIQLVVAGHTHGGQISIPFVTEQILPLGGEKYVKGNYFLQEDVELIVTRGIGMTQLPFRFMNVPEIISIEVKN
ncbi:MAG: metallophosphoesterase [Eubacteriaceae bacterium]